MIFLTVDARDAAPNGGSCSTCCCTPIAVRPDETSLVMLSYAPWAVPIGMLGCEPQFNVEQLQACAVPSGDNLPPVVNGPVSFLHSGQTPLAGNVSTFVTDPEGDALTFALLPFHSTMHGKLDFHADGTFTYTPLPAFTGLDRFWFTVSDGVNDPVVVEAVIGQGIPTVTPAMFTPPVRVRPNQAVIDQRGYLLTFPVEVSPGVRQCEAFRLTVRMGAYDCDGRCFWHMSCYDIRVGRC